MPPLIEYKFEDILNSNIEVVIKTYSLEQAYNILVKTTKNPNDFKYVPTTSN